jgi:hypothetical protein
MFECTFEYVLSVVCVDYAGLFTTVGYILQLSRYSWEMSPATTAFHCLKFLTAAHSADAYLSQSSLSCSIAEYQTTQHELFH